LFLWLSCVLIMNPNLLQAFLAVSRHRSFTRAAADLFISQPAVSRQIQQLERELGVALFEKIGKSLHLTDAGRTLADEAESALGNLGRIVEAVRAHAAPSVGRLRIGAATTPGLYMLPTPLGDFLREHPGVELSYLIEPSDQIVRRVVANEIDVGFIGATVEASGIASEAIAHDEVVCFASPRHPAAQPKRIDIRNLLDTTWIVRPKGSATRALFDSWQTEIGIRFEHTIELACPEGIRALVAAGVGLSYMSVYGLHDSLRRRTLVKVPINGMRLRRSIIAIHHVDKQVSAVMDEFLGIVREAFRKLPKTKE